MTSIEQFLQSASFGVVGASTDRSKFGNRVLRHYLKHHRIAYPVNPNEDAIEGIRCFATVADLPTDTKSISIITPPLITVKIVEAAIAKGIEHIWMQPGAEHLDAIALAEKHGINVIADGSCILVVLRD